ncbi:MAG TPA: hypothetical protein VKS79_13925 [Gemmataceae bacterium]|nr:hypothetical protein [Gemmataceae bacterium]
MSDDFPNDAPRLHVDTWHARRKRGLATVGILLLLALPVAGFVMVAVDRVREAADRAH